MVKLEQLGARQIILPVCCMPGSTPISNTAAGHETFTRHPKLKPCSSLAETSSGLAVRSWVPVTPAQGRGSRAIPVREAEEMVP